MAPQLQPFRPIDAGRIALDRSAVADDQVTDGAPTTGSVALGTANGAELGLWEMSVGGMRDVEVDEYFVVLSGEATVTLWEHGAEVDRIELRPGTLCRLAAGSHTRWDVRETLRKVYVLGAPAEPQR